MNILRVALLLPLQSFQRKGVEFLVVCIVDLDCLVIVESDELCQVSMSVVMEFLS